LLRASGGLPAGLHGPLQDRQGVPAIVGGRGPEREGWRSPIEKVPAPRATMETLDPLNLEDLRAMLATCERRTFAGDRDGALTLALPDMGCRASESLALDLGDLDPRTGATCLLSLRRDNEWVIPRFR